MTRGHARPSQRTQADPWRSSTRSFSRPVSRDRPSPIAAFARRWGTWPEHTPRPFATSRRKRVQALNQPKSAAATITAPAAAHVAFDTPASSAQARTPCQPVQPRNKSEQQSAPAPLSCIHPPPNTPMNIALHPNTLINIDALHTELLTHPNPAFVHSLISNLHAGCRIGFAEPRHVSVRTIVSLHWSIIWMTSSQCVQQPSLSRPRRPRPTKPLFCRSLQNWASQQQTARTKLLAPPPASQCLASTLIQRQGSCGS